MYACFCCSFFWYYLLYFLWHRCENRDRYQVFVSKFESLSYSVLLLIFMHFLRCFIGNVYAILWLNSPLDDSSINAVHINVSFKDVSMFLILSSSKQLPRFKHTFICYKFLSTVFFYLAITQLELYSLNPYSYLRFFILKQMMVYLLFLLLLSEKVIDYYIDCVLSLCPLAIKGNYFYGWCRRSREVLCQCSFQNYYLLNIINR